MIWSLFKNLYLNTLSGFLINKCEDETMELLKYFKDYEPIYSKIIDLVRLRGSPELCRKYLECLTLSYHVNDKRYHTELAVSYINEIKNIVDSKYTYEGEVDVESVHNDTTIFDLRKKLREFLESSKLYNANTIFRELPHQYMLHEIAFILAWAKKYNIAFEICVSDLKDIEYSEYICQKVYKNIADDSIFFELFKIYIENKLTDLAVNLLESKHDKMPYDKVFSIFKEDDIFREKYSKVFNDMFTQKLNVEGQIIIKKEISKHELLKAKAELCTAESQWF